MKIKKIKIQKKSKKKSENQVMITDDGCTEYKSFVVMIKERNTVIGLVRT